jgi:DNA-binding MarR family transcriptional regulator
MATQRDTDRPVLRGVPEPIGDEDPAATVLRATRAFVSIAARSLAVAGGEVSLAQLRVLVLLETWGAQTMSELAASLDVGPSTVTRVCDVLVDKGLIRRTQPEGNRRTVVATLTPRGRRLLDRVMARRRALIDEALSRLPAESQRRLARALSEFARVVDDEPDHAWTLGWGSAVEGTLSQSENTS